MIINGNKIKLQPAIESDREKIYDWLARSDLTPSMMGPPKYTDHPIPSWNEFCSDYVPSFFNASGDGKGRNYIITANDEEAGTIGYDLLNIEADSVVLDIWMRAERFCGKGYGSDALSTLCNYLHKKYGITTFIISFSSRNERAAAAYKRAGFKYIKNLTKEEQEELFGVSEYDDNVLMIKRLITDPSIGPAVNSASM